MTNSRHAVFVINLLQDVNILRPLVYMAANDLGLYTHFLVSDLFVKRDKSGVWLAEIEGISEQTRSQVLSFASTSDALLKLAGLSGVMVAGSESNLSAHQPVHDLFLVAPKGWVKVTLQHGFECVGFMQSRDQNLAHGTGITFAADVICGWAGLDKLCSVSPSQASKLVVTGPSSILHMQPPATQHQEYGLVCENLHSPRMKAAGDFKHGFVDAFSNFCGQLSKENKKVVLRPHPGGQYVLKNDVPIPKNVVVNNNPSYKVDFSRYAYGISAPSSVLIDMVLANIPVAVWRDGGKVMDAGNYSGLAEISSADDWVEFSREAVLNPEKYLEKQSHFLTRLGMPTAYDDVYQRYSAMLRGLATRQLVEVGALESINRVAFIANDILPTLEISFLEPLAPFIAAGTIQSVCLTEAEIRKLFAKRRNVANEQTWLLERLSEFRPSILVFCRYSGPHVEFMLSWAKKHSVPVVMHIDDDLLSIPEHFGKTKFEYHNHPDRISTLRFLLNYSSLIYCSTERLATRLADLGAEAPIKFGEIYCSGKVLNLPQKREVRTIGYMGHSEKFEDLRLVMPALTEFLRRHPDVRFELFGSVRMPDELLEFGDRAISIPGVRGYEAFLKALANRNWDIGICPLQKTSFNLVKANTKWLDYTAVGTAVIATSDTVYDDCCSDGCGITADTTEEWLNAFEYLYANPSERFRMVENAQKKVMEFYSKEKLQAQVITMLNLAVKNHLAGRCH